MNNSQSLVRWLPVLLCFFLCGCFEVQDELTIHPAGSGQVRMVVRSTLPPDVLQAFTMGGNSGSMPIYPPVTEVEAKRFFPEKDFATAVEESSHGVTNSITIIAKFKDVNALLASPYGRAHQLLLKPSPDGRLTVTAISAGEPLARAAQVNPTNDFVEMPLPNLAGLDLAKRKDQMRFEFRLVLPDEVKESNGQNDAVAVSWVTERAKCRDDEEFAQKLSTVLHAAWSGDSVRFTPANKIRLGLAPFPQLAEEKTTGTGAAPEAKSILAAAKFVPKSLQVTRTVDLSGSGYGQGSQAILNAELALPTEFAPMKWGKPTVREATDASGANLIVQEQGTTSPESAMFSHRYGLRMNSPGADQARTNAAVAKQQLTLVFKAPEWRVKEIEVIKGEIELQYPGGMQILKLTNAVPASMVSTPRRGRISYNSNPREILDPRLVELGATVKVQMAAYQNGITTLSLQTGGKNSLLDAQVFDADGRPWPTTFWKPEDSRDDEVYTQIMVPGKPKPPFSLALCFNAGGSTLKVPFQVEKVPVGGNPGPSAKR